MDTTADIWTEQMLQAQRVMLETQGRRIRALERLLHSVLDMVQGGFADAIPVGEIRESLVTPLLPGVVPTEPQGPGHTEPVIHDEDEVAILESIRTADEGTPAGRPTIEVQTVGGDRNVDEVISGPDYEATT